MKNKYNLDLCFLEKLLNTTSVSGYESQTGKIIKEYFEKFATTHTDVLGNVIGVVNSKSPFKVIVSAHYDEIGFQVVFISDDGFIFFRKVGFVDKLIVPGSIVTISTSNGDVIGVIGKNPPHIQSNEERNRSLEIEDLFIDIGATSKEDASKLVSIGDVAAFAPNYTNLINNNIVSKGLDDKIGVFIISEVLKILSTKKIDVGLYIVCTTQEELGTRGMAICGNRISPDIGICVDVGVATDTPTVSKRKWGELNLGSGVGICHSADNNIKLVKKLRHIANQHSISIQNTTALVPSGGTDTARLQISQDGVATALLSIPNRYMHSSVEMCNLKDVNDAITLIIETIVSLKGVELFNPLE